MRVGQDRLCAGHGRRGAILGARVVSGGAALRRVAILQRLEAWPACSSCPMPAAAKPRDDEPVAPRSRSSSAIGSSRRRWSWARSLCESRRNHGARRVRLLGRSLAARGNRSPMGPSATGSCPYRPASGVPARVGRFRPSRVRSDPTTRRWASATERGGSRARGLPEPLSRT